MRDSLLAELACPGCGGDLFVAEASAINGGHIEQGVLGCRGCAARVPIEHSVPNFVPSDDRADVQQTTSGFARNWDEFNDVILDNEQLNDELFRDWIAPLQPESFKDKLVLEPGCGMGRWLRVAARYGPRALIGLDYSTVAYTAARNVAHLENAHVVRADILRLPLKKRIETAYCLGVVHHTPDPARTFDALVQALGPQGLLSVWVYGAEGNGWITSLVDPVRKNVTSRMPHRVLGALSVLLALPLYGAAKVSAAVPLPYRSYLAHLRRYPFKYMSHIVYDHLVPEIAHYLPRAELEAWVSRNGLHAQISARNGNSWRLLAGREAQSLPQALPKTGT